MGVEVVEEEVEGGLEVDIMAYLNNLPATEDIQPWRIAQLPDKSAMRKGKSRVLLSAMLS